MRDEQTYRYKVAFAGIPMTINCHFPYEAYNDFRTEDAPLENISVDLRNLSMLRQYKENPAQDSLQNEECIQCIGEAGSILLKHNRFIIHGTAFHWHGKVWIFTGPSGIGKTTQYLHWKHLYGAELTLLNGDKPILEFCENGRILVHPSPWKGKENMGNLFSAPLGGIVLLMQGKENRLRKLTPSQAALPLYMQILFLQRGEDLVKRVCELETQLLSKVSVWEYVNTGDLSSAEYLHDMLTGLESL